LCSRCDWTLLRRNRCNANICLEILYSTVLPETDQHHDLGCVENDDFSLFLVAIFTLFSIRNFRYELIDMDHLVDYHVLLTYNVLTFLYDVLIIRDKSLLIFFKWWNKSVASLNHLNEKTYIYILCIDFLIRAYNKSHVPWMRWLRAD
jgi:hypothetical protein